jgi:uncharacterized protein YkwD
MRRALVLVATVGGWVLAINLTVSAVAPPGPVYEVEVATTYASATFPEITDPSPDRLTPAAALPSITSTAPTTSTTAAPSTTTAPPTTTTAAPTTTTTRPKPKPTTTSTTNTTAAPTTTAAPAGSFSSSAESDFVNRINGLRADNGLPALKVDGDLKAYARNWAEHMATVDKFQHSDIGDLLNPWTIVGENIGKGGSVASLFQALVNSPGHYANMVEDAFTHVGVGVWIDDDGTMWTTHVFAGK